MVRILTSRQILGLLICRSLILFIRSKEMKLMLMTKYVISLTIRKIENNLATYLPHNFLLMIMYTPIPISDTDDKIICKFNSTGHFSIKSTTWTNNTSIVPHPKAKFINGLWKLKLRPK